MREVTSGLRLAQAPNIGGPVEAEGDGGGYQPWASVAGRGGWRDSFFRGDVVKLLSSWLDYFLRTTVQLYLKTSHSLTSCPTTTTHLALVQQLILKFKNIFFK